MLTGSDIARKSSLAAALTLLTMAGVLFGANPAPYTTEVDYGDGAKTFTVSSLASIFRETGTWNSSQSRWELRHEPNPVTISRPLSSETYLRDKHNSRLAIPTVTITRKNSVGDVVRTWTLTDCYVLVVRQTGSISSGQILEEFTLHVGSIAVN